MARFVSPDEGYRKDWLWLPLRKIQNVRGIQNSLTFWTPEKRQINAWSIEGNHLVVPREFIPFEKWGELPFQIIDDNDFQFPVLEGVQMLSELRGPIQATSALVMGDRGSGVLSLACGMGKTVVFLHSWVQKATPALVVVNTVDLEEQWRARILEHTNLSEDDIGQIRGPVMDWEKPITIASIQTLAARIDDAEFPEEMRNHFGVVGYDEVHHLGAPEFNTTAALGKGIRWGLSATPSRRDGTDLLYQYHLGPILYQNYEQDVIPETWFVRTGVRLGEQGFLEVRDRHGNINLSKLMSWLAKHKERNERIAEWIDRMLVENRYILFLSPRVEHLEGMAEQYKELGDKVGVIHGEKIGEDRAQVLNNCQVIFATLQLAKEGLDRKELDSLVIPLPFTDEGMFRQVYGRIQRPMAGKEPVVLIFEDEFIKPIHEMCKKMRHLLGRLQYPFDIARD